MAENSKSSWHARALRNPGLSPEARAYHEKQLAGASGGASSGVPQPSKSSAPKPPRAARKKAPASPPAGPQRAATPVSQSTEPALEEFPKHSLHVGGKPTSAAAAYTAAHAHLHTGTQPAAPQKPRSQPQISHTPEQLTALAGYHEQEQRKFAAAGDARGAAVHGDKAAAARQALAQHAQQGGAPGPTGGAHTASRRGAPVNPEAERHRVEAKAHTASAAEARMHASKANRDLAAHLHNAATAGDDTQSAAHKAQAAESRAGAARFRAQAAHHQAASAESSAHAAEAENNGPEKAAHVARAARFRARAARFQQEASENRAQTAQHQAATQGQEQQKPRDVQRERRERIESASKAFHQIIHTGSRELISQLHKQVGH